MDSNTGTTLDMSREFIESIKVPVIINALGYAELYNLEDSSPIFEKFHDFIMCVCEQRNWLVTVRNDGSHNRIKQRFGDRIAKLIYEVPDNGFFFDREIKKQNYLVKKNLVGIQIANDSFYGADKSGIDMFNKNIGLLLQQLIDDGKRIVFFPHTPQDIEVIYKLIKLVHDTDVRSNVSVAPFCAASIDDARINVSWYKSCDFCISMRFHSNIICLQNFIPVIALDVDFFSHNSRLVNFYDWLGCSDFLFHVDSRSGGYIQDLMVKIHKIEKDKNSFTNKISFAMNKVEREKSVYFDLIRNYLN